MVMLAYPGAGMGFHVKCNTWNKNTTTHALVMNYEAPIHMQTNAYYPPGSTQPLLFFLQALHRPNK